MIFQQLLDNSIIFACFYAIAFLAFWLIICLSTSVAAFRRGAFLAFISIKHRKHEKQSAVFLMNSNPGEGKCKIKISTKEPKASERNTCKILVPPTADPVIQSKVC